MKKELKSMGRRELQALCKKHGLRANSTNANMAASLASVLEEADRAVMIQGEEMLQPAVRGQGTKGGSIVALANQSCENNTDPYAFLVDWNSMLIEEKAQSAKCPVTDDQFPASITGTGETMESTMARDIIFDKELLEENKTGRTPDDNNPTSKPATSRDSYDSKERVTDNNDCSPIVRGSGLLPRTANTSLIHDEIFRRDSEPGDGDSDDTENIVTSNIKVMSEHKDRISNVRENLTDTEEYKVEHVIPFIPEQGHEMYSVSEVAAPTSRILDYQGSAPRQVSTVPHSNSSGTLEIESTAYGLGMKDKTIAGLTTVVSSDFATGGGGDVRMTNVLMEIFDLVTTDKETKNQKETDLEEAEDDDSVHEVMGEVIDNLVESTISSMKKGGQEALSNEIDSVAPSTGSVTSTVSVTSNASSLRWPLRLIQGTDVVIILVLFLFFAYVTLLY